MIKPLKHWSPLTLKILNWVIIFGSVILCALALPLRFSGLELNDIGPNWMLVWVVVWSVKRTALQGALAGFALGLIQDGMTVAYPTHVFGLALAGVLTARLQKQRFIQEDFISVALIVFGMAVIAETVMALQFSFRHDRPLIDIWLYHQQIALSSAILSSLWAPVVYYPLNHWWERLNGLEQS
jgi:rod shape-determining protein MreD